MGTTNFQTSGDIHENVVNTEIQLSKSTIVLLNFSCSCCTYANDMEM